MEPARPSAGRAPAGGGCPVRAGCASAGREPDPAPRRGRRGRFEDRPLGARADCRRARGRRRAAGARAAAPRAGRGRAAARLPRRPRRRWRAAAAIGTPGCGTSPSPSAPGTWTTCWTGCCRSSRRACTSPGRCGRRGRAGGLRGRAGQGGSSRRGRRRARRGPRVRGGRRPSGAVWKPSRACRRSAGASSCARGGPGGGPRPARRGRRGPGRRVRRGHAPTTVMCLELLLGLEPGGGLRRPGLRHGRAGDRRGRARLARPRSRSTTRRRRRGGEAQCGPQRGGAEVLRADLLEIPPPPAPTLAANVMVDLHARDRRAPGAGDHARDRLGDRRASTSRAARRGLRRRRRSRSPAHAVTRSWAAALLVRGWA